MLATTNTPKATTRSRETPSAALRSDGVVRFPKCRRQQFRIDRAIVPFFDLPQTDVPIDQSGISLRMIALWRHGALELLRVFTGTPFAT
jgi:hypothetical protein